jgi:cell division protein FtsI/penicillin-binding protein 2
MLTKKNNVLMLVAGLAFLVLLLRLFQLQLIEGGKYQRLAGDNGAKTVVAPAPRGIIYDFDPGLARIAFFVGHGQTGPDTGAVG